MSLKAVSRGRRAVTYAALMSVGQLRVSKGLDVAKKAPEHVEKSSLSSEKGRRGLRGALQEVPRTAAHGSRGE